jgi:hypothetical protein
MHIATYIKHILVRLLENIRRCLAQALECFRSAGAASCVDNKLVSLLSNRVVGRWQVDAIFPISEKSALLRLRLYLDGEPDSRIMPRKAPPILPPLYND